MLATPAPVTHRTAEENLGLGYLAAMLRHAGFSVQIIDGWLSNLTTQQVAAEIRTGVPPLFIGSRATARTYSQLSRRAASYARRKPPCPVSRGPIQPHLPRP